ncbi:MAG: glycosyltransferase family 2 protein [Fibrobacterota bacterium]
MGEVKNRIRSRFEGPSFEREPHVTSRERMLLGLLVAVGVQSIFFFAEYWFNMGLRKEPFFFALLTFAVFWNPVRNLYNWWVYLWARHPEDDERWTESVKVAGTTADVLTTAMPGEPFEMFQRTLTAISRLECLNQAFLLDGGNDPALKALCERLGVNHVDCRVIGGAKAGKINHCLREHSRAEFVLVIDPDHIPKAQFLSRTLNHFADSSVGFVQVVQAYHNLRESWVAWGAAEQTFGFYGATQMGLGGLGIPTAIGANCTFRRAALDSIGGHAEHLAEDALTSMRIHAQGWKSVYLPWRGSEGLVPTDLGTFWKQQLKWATGMSYLLFQEYPNLFHKFLPSERLHYFAAATFYVGGLAQAMNLLLPIVFLFAKFYAVEMPLGGFLSHIIPYALVSTAIFAMVQKWSSHREEIGFPWRSMLLEKASWHINLLGIVYGATGRKVPYLPTPKEGSEKPIPMLVAPHWAVIVLSISAIAWVPFGYQRLDAGTVLMMVFAGVNACMLFPAAWIGIRGWFAKPVVKTEIVGISIAGGEA